MMAGYRKMPKPVKKYIMCSCFEKNDFLVKNPVNILCKRVKYRWITYKNEWIVPHKN